MAKNIVVFSDGTGQDGGVRPEQRMSNVYKLHRASHNHPESGIDPCEQVAFYDPGLGTDIGSTALTAQSVSFRSCWDLSSAKESSETSPTATNSLSTIINLAIASF